MQWNRTFAEHTDSYFLRCAAEAFDEGYLLGGKYLIKVDSLGNVQWNRSISVSSIVKTSDEGYVLVKHTQLAKVDLQGNIDWVNSYVGGQEGAVTHDDGYILSGHISDTAPYPVDIHGYIVKTDVNGTLE